MATLLIAERDVQRLLPMHECIEVMARTMRALARGQAILPLRTIIPLPANRGAFASMPAVLLEPDALGIKVITVFPQNEGTLYDSHQGAVLLFEAEHGSLAAVLDGSTITALRTAAVSAVATRVLAREPVAVLAILGSGVQAATHLEAMLAVRRFSTIRVWSRNADRARAFARAQSAKFYLQVEVAGSAEAAVRGADVLCTTTSSREPILKGEWLTPGAHLNVIGASQRTAREVDAEAVRRSRLYVDRRESALNEAGDFLIAKAEGAVDDDHIVGELGQVLEAVVPGRRTEQEITLFRGLGLAIEDVAAAQHVYAKAAAENAVASVELGGRRGPT